jgi:hypothetical protein
MASHQQIVCQSDIQDWHTKRCGQIITAKTRFCKGFQHFSQIFFCLKYEQKSHCGAALHDLYLVILRVFGACFCGDLSKSGAQD